MYLLSFGNIYRTLHLLYSILFLLTQHNNAGTKFTLSNYKRSRTLRNKLTEPSDKDSPKFIVLITVIAVTNS